MPGRRLKSKAVAAGLLMAQGGAAAFSGSDSVAVYWGQNSYGSGGNLAQQSLATYCANTDIDIIPMSFLIQIKGGQGGMPVINFANTGDSCTTFPNTQLLNCPDIAKDIQTCQQKYKKTILLSIGGATYTEGGFKSEQEAIDAANLLWDMFGPVGFSSSSIEALAEPAASVEPLTLSSFVFANASVTGIRSFPTANASIPVRFSNATMEEHDVAHALKKRQAISTVPSNPGAGPTELSDFIPGATSSQAPATTRRTSTTSSRRSSTTRAPSVATTRSGLTELSDFLPGRTTNSPSSDPETSSSSTTSSALTTKPTTSSKRTTTSKKRKTTTSRRAQTTSRPFIVTVPNGPGSGETQLSDFIPGMSSTQGQTTRGPTTRAPTTTRRRSTTTRSTSSDRRFRVVTYTFRTTHINDASTSIETNYVTRTENNEGWGAAEATGITDMAEDIGAFDGDVDANAVLRPFHDAYINGFDLDIEAPTQNFLPFAKRLNALMKAANNSPTLGRQFFLTTAPQCPYPDAYNDFMLNGGVEFDAVFVQFYNNYCGIQSYAPGAANQWNYNFERWDQWAMMGSANPNVKIFVGVPAGPSAAGSGYLSLANLKPVIDYSRKFSSFGGIMAWDASQAYANDGFLKGVKALIATAAVTTTTASSTTTRTTSSTTSRMVTTTRAVTSTTSSRAATTTVRPTTTTARTTSRSTSTTVSSRAATTSSRAATTSIRSTTTSARPTTTSARASTTTSRVPTTTTRVVTTTRAATTTTRRSTTTTRASSSTTATLRPLLNTSSTRSTTRSTTSTTTTRSTTRAPTTTSRVTISAKSSTTTPSTGATAAPVAPPAYGAPAAVGKAVFEYARGLVGA